MNITINSHTTTISLLDQKFVDTMQQLDSKMRKFTPYDEFKSRISGFEEKLRKTSYSVNDVNNKLRTTDRYIDQFLPFRMIKEVSHFMEYLLPDDMARKIQALKHEKIKELYTHIFDANEVIEFKVAIE